MEARATEDRTEPEERLRRRSLEAAPLVNAVVARCQEIRGRYPPSDPLAKAAGYVLNQQRALQRFLEDGRLPIDNTLVERRLRPVATGRKNYLFCGSEAGAQRAAVIYSLVGSCALAGVEPRAYIEWVLTQLEIQRFPHSHLDELLPNNWAKACAASARISTSR